MTLKEKIKLVIDSGYKWAYSTTGEDLQTMLANEQYVANESEVTPLFEANTDMYAGEKNVLLNLENEFRKL